LLTHVKAGATGTAATTYDLGVTYGLSEKVDLSGGYLRQTRNNNVANVQQLTGALDYKFSKRTDVYLAWAYNRDQGRKSYAVFGGGSQSSDGQQNVLRAGIRPPVLTQHRPGPAAAPGIAAVRGIFCEVKNNEHTARLYRG
jgi:predicted porin